MMATGIIYALLAGFLGAVASSSAKLSLGASYIKGLCEAGVRRWTVEGILTSEVDTTSCEWLHIPLRVLCGLLLLLCNTVMWTFFAKALRHSSSSAQATVTTTASNFIFSAFFGHLIFGERHAMLWWVGIFLTLLGLFVLHGSPSRDQKLDVKKGE
ncbi:transmembrane protein 42 [Electrophorus electricus]|uniref:transmembrane protein 42 n=1 Tax=Electrophorus electricus TaxID=8005 RepID=UPI0015CFE17D|nr:transmembrane protein 42 [Electrophorus electricus]